MKDTNHPKRGLHSRDLVKGVAVAGLGEDLTAGEGGRAQMRMVIGEFASDPEKHAALYQIF